MSSDISNDMSNDMSEAQCPLVALQVQGLCFAAGGTPILRELNAHFKAACLTAVVGPNGAGKSTLLTVLAGLRPPQSGQVRLTGKTLAQWPARERAAELAWMPQGQGASALGAADAADTVNDSLALELVRLARIPARGWLRAWQAEDEALALSALHELDAEHLAQRRMPQLSGGERQRVLLARTLAVGAKVLLLDEPLTHLDPPHQGHVMRLLRQRAHQGACVVAVLHDINAALAADELLVLNQGRAVAHGPVQDPKVREALVAVFEGAFRLQLLPGEPPASALRASEPKPRWLAVPRY